MTDEICIENPDSREPQSPAPRGRHSAGAAGHASASSESKVRTGKAAHAVSKPGRAAARKAAHGKGKPPKRRKKARRGPAAGIVRSSVYAAVAIIIVLGIVSLFRPQINLARAHGFVARGEIEEAESLVEYMIRREYKPEGIVDVRLDLGEYYLGRNDYANVYALLDELPDDERSQSLRQRTEYAEASAFLAAGEIDRAAQQFYRLGTFEDSADRYDDARVAIALRAYFAGKVDSARHMFIAVDDPAPHVRAGALALYGNAEEADNVAAMPEFSPANLKEMRETYEALSNARSVNGSVRLAAGYRHTVGLRDDGLVLAAGNNSKGQCNVTKWRDIVQVAAGAAHTVGLRLDGTVVATGDNSYGQCSVSKWNGIKAIAANAFCTFGLKSDGTVVATREMANAVTSWHGVTAISGGSYSAGCLYGQGSMLCTHKSAQLDMSSALDSLSVCGGVSAGISIEGSLVTSYDRAPNWKDLVCVAATTTGLLGVTEDGRALHFIYRNGTAEELPIEGKAIEAAGSGTHAVVLTDSGQVFAFGANGSGQCDVSDWQL